MKKTSVISSLFALGAAVAMAAEPVPSVNAVGYYTVTLPTNGQFVMVGSPFDPTGSDTNVQRTLLDIFGTNSGLRTSTSRSLVDRVYIWDFSSQKYLIVGQKTNGLFASTATASSWNLSTNPVIPRGFGFFMSSYVGSSDPVTITMLGQVPSSLTNALTIYGDVLSSPFQMIMNPYPVIRTLDSLINTNHGAIANSSRSQCDRVFLWNDVAQKYEILGLKAPTNRWYYSSTASAWATEIDPVVVAPGQAFWYLSKTNFVWKSDKTYVWP